MKNTLVYRVAKLMWALPAVLLLLAMNQAKVAYDLHYTLNNGVAAVADVIEVVVNDRVDIPYGYVSLRVELEDGQEIVQEKMSLPYTLLPKVRYEEQLDVRVFLEANQQIVIQQIASTQWKIAAIQSLILIVGLLMAGIGVLAWNRLLKKKGDPAAREIALD